jgi:hypothetical protein
VLFSCVRRLRRPIGTFVFSLVILQLRSRQIDRSTIVCKVRDLEVFQIFSGVHLIDVHLINICLMGMHLEGICRFGNSKPVTVWNSARHILDTVAAIKQNIRL